MSSQIAPSYEFGPFHLDLAEQQLRRAGEPVSLTPKVLEMLALLVCKNGRLVEKDELMKALWPDSFVEEANLTRYVWTLRQALGESKNGVRYIETVPKRGYRFIAPVRVLPDAMSDELVLEQHTLTRIVTEETQEEMNGQGAEDVAASALKLQPRLSGSVGQRRTRRSLTFITSASFLCLLVIVTALALSRPWTSRETKEAESATTAAAANAAANQPELKSIAVLPFKNIGLENDNEYLGLGLADALINKLGNVQQLIVRPTNAIRRYTDPNGDPVAIGRQQHVDAVLDGSIQRDGERLRLTVQLIRVRDGATLWANHFDERFTDIFALQDSISQQMTCDLVTRLCGETEARVFKSEERVNIAAYDAYLKGRYFWNKRTRDGYAKAIEYFKQAIESDPTYARAYAGLGDAYGFLGGNDPQTQAATIAKARAATRRALELDESLSEAHASLGLIAMNSDWDWAEADREFRRAIELNHHNATAHQWYGEFLAYMGRFDEAIAESKRAQELDPLSLIISTDLALVYQLARRDDEAIAQYRRTLEMDSGFAEAHALLGMTYASRGFHQEAESEFHEIKDLENNPLYLSFLGYALGVAGKKEEAEIVLKQLQNLSKRTYVSPYWMTLVYAGLGDKDETFKWFEKDLAEHASGGAVSLKVNPIYDGLRSDPRFADLLRRVGLT